jgi:competence protein ComEC
VKEDRQINRKKTIVLSIFISIILLSGTLAVVFGVNTLLTNSFPLNSQSPISSVSDTKGELRAFFFNVGQADAILLILPNGKTLLVDAGEASSARSLEADIRGKGVDRFDAVVATHPHADHIGGMSYLITNFNIGTIYMTRASTTTKTFENLLLAIAEKGLRVQTAIAGDSIDLDDMVEIRILSPGSLFKDSLNNNSVVLHIAYKGTSLLLMGDAEMKAENQILENETNIRSTILKVGHHGSGTSTGLEFLRSVNPQIAIISVGKDNRYQHPSDEVISQLEAAGIAIYRTDQYGTIEVRISKEGYTTHTENTEAKER